MEIDDFIAWHVARTKRRTGRVPAASTLRSTRTRLRAAMKAAGVDELCVLADTLTYAEKIEQVFDKLSLTNSSGSLRLVYESLKTFAEYAKVQGWSDGSLAIDPPAKNPQPPIVVYTQEQVDQIVSTARGRSLRWFMFLATVAHSGRRVGEVLGLRWEWLVLDHERPHFNLPTTKNKRQQYVPLDRFLVEECFTPVNVAVLKAEPRRRLNRSPAEHPFPYSYNGASKMFRRHCETLGIQDMGSFHRFRHTKATEMITRGVPLQAVSSILGHANIATTDRLYSHATTLDYAHYLDD